MPANAAAPMECAMTSAELIALMRDARARTLALVSDLAPEQQLGPLLAIVNPPRWEVGHVTWFNEYWTLRNLHQLPPLRAQGDALYDSAKVAHDTRWDLPLPSWEDTLRDGDEILARRIARLEGRAPSDKEVYFHLLAVFHEDMHDEAFTYTRQTLGYAAPRRGDLPAAPVEPPIHGDVEVPGGTFLLGADEHTSGFVFDNEKWAHAVAIKPFRIDRKSTR